MEGPRAPTQSEWPQVVNFLNLNLRPESQWSIAHEYPTALSTTNLDNIRIITEGHRVLSHAVLRPLIVKSPTAILKVGAIGSVVTDGERRGQGLSSSILQACVEEARRQDCDIALLWTNLYDFYRRMDFELAGVENSIILQEEFSADSAGLRFMKGNAVSSEAILRLYLKHSVGSVRTSEDIRKFLQIPNTILYTAWHADGQLAAYAVEGKGVDLKGYIHEWGGSVSKLLALLSWIRKEKKSPLTVILGQQSQNLLAALRSIPSVVHNEGYLGMIKIVNEAALFAKVVRTARNIGIDRFVLDKRDGEYLLGVGEDVIQFPDATDMVRVLFGPIPQIPVLKPETLQTIQRILPMPIWIWGWDSV